MSTRETILDILEEMHSDVDYDTEDKLVTNKILDSFDLVSLVTELSDEFDIQITAKDFVEENFNSLDTLTAMVERLMEE
ncbi:MAG: phosphopantetheine-binding protein [Lachnospiraceae bacterium]|nr:phosphopantetheine-binding protein [Lachnospiraceae bacterium]